MNSEREAASLARAHSRRSSAVRRYRTGPSAQVSELPCGLSRSGRNPAYASARDGVEREPAVTVPADFFASANAATTFFEYAAGSIEARGDTASSLWKSAWASGVRSREASQTPR